MNLQKLLSAREGHRATIEELLVQLEAAIEDNQHDDFELSFQTINEEMALLKSIDEKIANSTDSIATEIKESALYIFHLKRKLHRYKKAFERALSGSNTPPTSHAQEVEDSNQSSIPHTTLPIVPETREFLPHVSVQPMAHHLPKLTLPTFNGELMSWPTF